MRLLIQAVAVVEMVVLTLWGVGWGLCAQHDKLCMAFLPLDQGGRSMLHAVAATPPLQQHQQPQQQTIDATVALDDEDRGWLPPLPLTCNNNNGHMNTLHSRRRIRLHLVLQIESGTDWAHSSAAYQTWSDAWNQWITETNIARWPLWTETPSSSVVVGGRLTAKATKHQENHATYLLVSTQRVEEEFKSSTSDPLSYSTTTNGPLQSNEHHAALEIILYVPSEPEEPLLFEDVHNKRKRSEALVIQGNRLIILQQPNTTIHDSMSYLIPFLTNTIGIEDPIDRPGIETWLTCIARSSLDDFQVELESVRQWLIQSAADISISTHIGEQWKHAELLLRNATQRFDASQRRANPKELVEVIELLERGQQMLDDLRYDPALLPPMYLQMDHTLAIFAPLLFPLVLPMVAGLIREYKHYKASSVS